MRKKENRKSQPQDTLVSPASLLFRHHALMPEAIALSAGIPWILYAKKTILVDALPTYMVESYTANFATNRFVHVDVMM